MSQRCRNFRRITENKTAILIVSFLTFFAENSPKVYADEVAKNNPPTNAPASSQPSFVAANASGSRNFYQVLDELLSDFEYDLKSGQVLGLKDLTIRNVATSENIPPSFKTHLELLVDERILKTTKTRLVSCAACRSKKTTLNGDSMTITSPENNAGEMQRVAKMNGIENFMDIAFAYEPGGMILSLQISDVESGTTLWSRTYNSQTTRASAQRRGVDYSDLQDAKMKTEYESTIQTMPVLYTVMAPKGGSGYSTSLGFGVRVTELYDNHSKEVGVEFNYYADTAALSGQASAKNNPQNLYSGVNFTMLFVHGWNVFGNDDNINKTRGMIFGGIGGTYASGFLGGLFRGTYEWKFAKHWTVNAFLGYRPQSTLVISGTTTAPVSGVEGGLGVGFIF
jgi:hypothetical protein